jgi:tripartite-type tricarboxylate transporter receptor subunit TctC
MKPRLNLVRLFALGMTGLTWAGISDAAALDYPTRPVRWVVGYPAGGTTDILARLIGQYLSEKLGQQFIVENKPGAGNNIATEAVIHSPPDGYTVLLVNPANGINTSLYKKLSFNFPRDVAPIAGITRVPNVMEVNPNVPAKTVAEFITYAKANPNKVNLASSGNGTSVHLSGELFMAMTDPCALPRLRTSAHRHDRRAGAGAVRQPAVFDRTRQGGQAARARGDHREALGCPTGRADRGGDRAGLRGERVVWHGRAQGYSARGHCGAQQDDQ